MRSTAPTWCSTSSVRRQPISLAVATIAPNGMRFGRRPRACSMVANSRSALPHRFAALAEHVARMADPPATGERVLNGEQFLHLGEVAREMEAKRT